MLFDIECIILSYVHYEDIKEYLHQHPRMKEIIKRCTHNGKVFGVRHGIHVNMEYGFVARYYLGELHGSHDCCAYQDKSCRIWYRNGRIHRRRKPASILRHEATYGILNYYVWFLYGKKKKEEIYREDRLVKMCYYTKTGKRCEVL